MTDLYIYNKIALHLVHLYISFFQVTPYGLVVKIYSFSGAIHAAHMIHKRSYEINDEVSEMLTFKKVTTTTYLTT